MKKPAIFLLTLVCSVSLATGCSSGASSSASASPSDSSSGPVIANTSGYQNLVVGLDENFPPMGFRDPKGELVGFDIDMAKEVSVETGIQMEFKPIDWSTKELELSSKRIDLLWNGVTITPDREKVWQFTKPYLKNRQIIIVKQGSSLKAKADLKEKTVGLQKDSSAMDAVKKDPMAGSIGKISEYSDNVLAFKDLEIGRIDALVCDEIMGKYYITTNKAPFTVLDENFGEENYGVGMRKDDKALNEMLQKALDNMNKNGKAAEISKKWFGDDIVVKN